MPPDEAVATEAPAAAETPAPGPQENESFAAAMARIEASGEGIASDDDPVEGEADEGEGGEGAGGGEKAAPGAKGTQKASSKAASKADGEPEPEAAGDGGGAEPGKPSKAFLEECEKLGLEVDNRGRVVNRERKQFREWKESQRKAIEEASHAEITRINEVKTAVRGELDLAKAVRSAYKARDPEALARALGAKDFAEMQDEFVKAYASPDYQRIRELEQENEARRVADQERERRQAEEANRKQEQQIEQRYLSGLTEQMRGSQSVAVKVFAEIPVLRDAIYEIQKEHWNGESTVSPERAIRLGRGGAPPLLEEMRGLYKALKPVFEEAPAEAEAEGEETAAKPVSKPAPKPAAKPVARAQPAGTKTGPTPKPAPSAPVDVTKMSEREYSKYVHRRLMESSIEDE